MNASKTPQAAELAADIRKNHKNNQKKQLIFWLGALILGGICGYLPLPLVHTICTWIATIFTRLFQVLAVPTIALAVITTLASLGANKQTGRIFGHAVTYTILTTVCAAAIGLALYVVIEPANVSSAVAAAGASQVPANLAEISYADHLTSIVPNNIVKPFLEGNVLSVLLVAVAIGLGLAFMPDSDNRQAVLKVIQGTQELFFTLIRGLLVILPIGIFAFACQLAVQMEAGLIIGALGKYTTVVIGGNLIQFFIVIPLFLLARGLNPIHVFQKMSPAIAVALFTKSSAGTLPVTLASAEENLKANPAVSRFVLPICTTINMNGCAAFILVTSLFVMQQAGIVLTLPTMVTWLFISVIAAIGNAGVPMGCYFLTLSLMTSLGVPIEIMGVILPLYTIIDMVETAENVWSDAAVCAMTDNDLKGKLKTVEA